MLQPEKLGVACGRVIRYKLLPGTITLDLTNSLITAIVNYTSGKRINAATPNAIPVLETTIA